MLLATWILLGLVNLITQTSEQFYWNSDVKIPTSGINILDPVFFCLHTYELTVNKKGHDVIKKDSKIFPQREGLDE